MGAPDTAADCDAAERTLVSIGYEGKTIDDLVAQLVEQDVQVLVDVRLTPLSPSPPAACSREPRAGPVSHRA